jgi:hypothetical protein
LRSRIGQRVGRQPTVEQQYQHHRKHQAAVAVAAVFSRANYWFPFHFRLFGCVTDAAASCLSHTTTTTGTAAATLSCCTNFSSFSSFFYFSFVCKFFRFRRRWPPVFEPLSEM